MTLMTSKKVDIRPRKLYLEFALMNLDSDETSRDTRTAVLHRISIPFIWAKWFGLASHFEENACFELISKITIFILLRTRSQNGFCPKCSYQKGACKHKHIHMHIHIHIHMHMHMYMCWALEMVSFPIL